MTDLYPDYDDWLVWGHKVYRRCQVCGRNDKPVAYDPWSKYYANLGIGHGRFLVCPRCYASLALAGPAPGGRRIH
jgi:hypothetical protein